MSIGDFRHWFSTQQSYERELWDDGNYVEDVKKSTECPDGYISTAEEMGILDKGYLYEYLATNRMESLSLHNFIKHMLPNIISTQCSFSIPMTTLQPAARNTKHSGSSRAQQTNILRAGSSLKTMVKSQKPLIANIRHVAADFMQREGHPFGKYLMNLAPINFQSTLAKQQLRDKINLCFSAELLRVDCSTMEQTSLEEVALGSATYGCDIWIRGRWSLEQSPLQPRLLSQTRLDRKLVPGTKPYVADYFLGKMPWPVNIPSPRALLSTSDVASIYHKHSLRMRAELGLEVAVLNAFVVVKGVCWALEGRAIQPEENPMLRQWKGGDIAFTCSVPTSEGSYAKTVDQIRLTTMGSTPLSLLSSGSVDARKWKSGFDDSIEKEDQVGANSLGPSNTNDDDDDGDDDEGAEGVEEGGGDGGDEDAEGVEEDDDDEKEDDLEDFTTENPNNDDGDDGKEGEEGEEGEEDVEEEEEGEDWKNEIEGALKSTHLGGTDVTFDENVGREIKNNLLKQWHVDRPTESNKYSYKYGEGSLPMTPLGLNPNPNPNPNSTFGTNENPNPNNTSQINLFKGTTSFSPSSIKATFIGKANNRPDAILEKKSSRHKNYKSSKIRIGSSWISLPKDQQESKIFLKSIRTTNDLAIPDVQRFLLDMLRIRAVPKLFRRRFFVMCRRYILKNSGKYAHFATKTSLHLKRLLKKKKKKLQQLQKQKVLKKTTTSDKISTVGEKNKSKNTHNSLKSKIQTHNSLKSKIQTHNSSKSKIQTHTSSKSNLPLGHELDSPSFKINVKVGSSNTDDAMRSNRQALTESPVPLVTSDSKLPEFLKSDSKVSLTTNDIDEYEITRPPCVGIVRLLAPNMHPKDTSIRSKKKKKKLSSRANSSISNHVSLTETEVQQIIEFLDDSSIQKKVKGIKMSYLDQMKGLIQEKKDVITGIGSLASQLPILTIQLYMRTAFEVPLCLIFRAFGIQDLDTFLDLIRGGDSKEEFVLYEDILRNCWYLDEGCSTREQALYRLGSKRCTSESLAAVEQVAWQGLWWFTYRFLDRLHPSYLRSNAALSMADYYWLNLVNPTASAHILEYLGPRECERQFQSKLEEIVISVQHKKLLFLAQATRRLCRAEAGISSYLTGRDGLTDKMVLHNRAVFNLDKLYAFNIFKAVKKAHAGLIKRVKEMGAITCLLDSKNLFDSEEFENTALSFACPRDGKKNKNTPLQRILQSFRGNVHEKLQLSRRVAQVAPKSSGLSAEQKFCLSQLGYLDACHTSKSNKSGYDKRKAFSASITFEMPMKIRETLKDWIQEQAECSSIDVYLKSILEHRHNQRALGKNSSSSSSSSLSSSSSSSSLSSSSSSSSLSSSSSSEPFFIHLWNEVIGVVFDNVDVDTTMTKDHATKVQDFEPTKKSKIADKHRHKRHEIKTPKKNIKKNTQSTWNKIQNLTTKLKALRSSPQHPDWYGLRYMSIILDPTERTLNLMVGSGRHTSPVWKTHSLYKEILLPRAFCNWIKTCKQKLHPSTINTSLHKKPEEKKKEEQGEKTKETKSTSSLNRMNIPGGDEIVTKYLTNETTSEYIYSNSIEQTKQCRLARNIWRILVRAGSIGWLSVQEAASLWCCPDLAYFRKHQASYPDAPIPDCVDITPTRGLGLNTLLIKGSECVSGARHIYATGMLSHCMSEPLSTEPFDGTHYTSAQADDALLQSTVTTNLSQNVSYCKNLGVAFRAWGPNQEDGYVFDKHYADRGGVDYEVRKTIATDLIPLHADDISAEQNIRWRSILEDLETNPTITIKNTTSIKPHQTPSSSSQNTKPQVKTTKPQDSRHTISMSDDEEEDTYSKLVYPKNNIHLDKTTRHKTTTSNFRERALYRRKILSRFSQAHNQYHDTKKSLFRQTRHQVSMVSDDHSINVPEINSFYEREEEVMFCVSIDPAEQEEKNFLARHTSPWLETTTDNPTPPLNLPAFLNHQSTSNAFPLSPKFENTPTNKDVNSPKTNTSSYTKSNKNTSLASHQRKDISSIPMDVSGFVHKEEEEEEEEKYKDDEKIQLEAADGEVEEEEDDDDVEEDFTSQYYKETQKDVATTASSATKHHRKNLKPITAPINGTITSIKFIILAKLIDYDKGEDLEISFLILNPKDIPVYVEKLLLLRKKLRQTETSKALVFKSRIKLEFTMLHEAHLGDKFCNRTGQKSTICAFVPAYQLPRSCMGETPVILLGPSQTTRGTPNDNYNIIHNKWVLEEPDTRHPLYKNPRLHQPRINKVWEKTNLAKTSHVPNSCVKIDHAVILDQASSLQKRTLFLQNTKRLAINTWMDSLRKHKEKATFKKQDINILEDLMGIWTIATRQIVVLSYLVETRELFNLPGDIEENSFNNQNNYKSNTRNTPSSPSSFSSSSSSSSSSTTPPKISIEHKLLCVFLNIVYIFHPQLFKTHIKCSISTSLATLQSLQLHKHIITHIICTCRDIATYIHEAPTLVELFPDLLLYEQWIAQTVDVGITELRNHTHIVQNSTQLIQNNTLSQANNKQNTSGQQTTSSQQETQTDNPWGLTTPLHNLQRWGNAYSMLSRAAHTRMLNPQEMTLDSKENRTHFGIHTITRNVKVAETGYKSRHIGSKDPLNHQGVKSNKENGAPRDGVMENEATAQSGGGKVLDQILESSDGKTVSLCTWCKGIGKIDQQSGTPRCFNTKCIERKKNDPEYRPEKHMVLRTTTHCLLKLSHTLNASGMHVELE